MNQLPTGKRHAKDSAKEHNLSMLYNSKISAKEKKERSGWGRVELGQLGTS